MTSIKSTRGFRRLSLITIGAVYLLILAGGIVRSTGSGMGCPDWPKCFGRFIPPTNESQLPEGWQEKYKVHGYIAEFNAAKTWIEYINRLLGAVVGVLIFLVVIYALPFLKKDKPVFYLSLITFFLVGFEAWLGKLVVSSNLSPVMVTVHMSGALVIVALLIYVIGRSRKDDLKTETVGNKKIVSVAVIMLLLLTFIQIVTGTQVREEIDVISAELNYQQRENWIDRLSGIFDVHRYFAWGIMILNGAFVFWLRKMTGEGSVLMKAGWLVFGLLGLEMILGIVMGRFGIPAFVQPLHLLIATMIFGIQFFMLTVLIFRDSNS